MAKVKKGSLLDHVTGAVGDLIIRTRNGKKHAYPKPVRKKKKLSAAEKKKQTRFREAIMYAQSILHDPEKKAAYAQTLPRGKTVYHSAIKEYLMNNPE